MIASPGFSSTFIDRWFSRIKPGIALFVVMTLGGCQPSSSDGREFLQVHAASSLTNAFEQLAQAFENAHSGIDVSLVFSGSQILRLQIEQGASADVLAMANQLHTEALVKAGLISKPQVFAHNELALIVPNDNPSGIESYADLPRAKRLVLGTNQVPVGLYTHQMLSKHGAGQEDQFLDRVLDGVVSRESNTRLVRAKVELGEADAAIVYRTDALGSDRVRSIPIPAEMNVQAQYFISGLPASERQQSIRDWIAFILSDEGQAILKRHGFVEG
ncbi:MAG: molybdate ABC transporter substrate-binding protein [Planctomycetota bacterium]